MHFIKKSSRTNPKVSFILLDWSVRETFQILHYLKNQTAGRESFEIIVIEYYSQVSDAVKQFEDQVDTWVILDIPEDCYYHKHLMYNVGIVLCNGEIAAIGDSDAMVKESFVQTIIDTFEKGPNTVLHFDQFRNARRDFYPFNYPSFDEVMGDGCINRANGKTIGMQSSVDTIHSRNYGACMCARRQDLIDIGGADEHKDYLGHICGPYDMTFRLLKKGIKETWSDTEFLCHTWHPGQAGDDNYLGPHDGRHISTRAIDTLIYGSHEPAMENEAIKALRIGNQLDPEFLEKALISKNRFIDWEGHNKGFAPASGQINSAQQFVGVYMGFRVIKNEGRFEAYPLFQSFETKKETVLSCDSWQGIVGDINSAIPVSAKIAAMVSSAFILLVSLSFDIAKLFWGVVKNRLNVKRKGKTLEPTSNPVSGRGSFSKLKLWFGGVMAVRRYDAELVQDLIINLSLMKRSNNSALPNRSYTAFVDKRIVKHLIATLKLTAIAPQVNTEVIRDIHHLKKRIESLGNEDVVIVSRNLFVQHHPFMVSFNSQQKAIII